MRPGSRSTGSRSASSAARVPPAAMAAAMTGAVDLAAVKARSEAAARAATTPPPAAEGGFVIDANEADFQSQVLDRSFQVPVLLDLWAEWCEPCKQLSPLLEKLAAESGGEFILAKIDVDANPQIVQSLQVQSIPTVFAVIAGQLVPGFQGALPEAQLREFIRALIDAGRQAGLPGGGGERPADAEGQAMVAEVPEDPRFVAAEEALEEGDFDLAADRYQVILTSEPANTEAQLALRQVALMKRLGELPPDVIELADAQPDDAPAQLLAADAEFAENEIEQAFARLIALVKRLRGEDRMPVRDRLVEYFELMGPEDPRVAPARRELANALF